MCKAYFLLIKQLALNHYLFSYGTLQKPKVQLSSFGRILKGNIDALPKYQLQQLKINDQKVLTASEQEFHPMAVFTNNTNDIIEGMVFEMSEDELFAADAYEVAEYKRIAVILSSGIEAWVYVKK